MASKFQEAPQYKFHIVDCVLQYSRYMYTIKRTYGISLKCYCCDLMATVTSAVTQKSTTVKLLELRAFYPKWSDDAPSTLWATVFFFT